MQYLKSCADITFRTFDGDKNAPFALLIVRDFCLIMCRKANKLANEAIIKGSFYIDSLNRKGNSVNPKTKQQFRFGQDVLLK